MTIYLVMELTSTCEGEWREVESIWLERADAVEEVKRLNENTQDELSYFLSVWEAF